MTYTTTAPLPQPSADTMPDVRTQTWQAASELGEIFRAVGINVSRVVVNDDDDRAPFINLGTVDAAAGFELARRIRKSMKPLLQTANALQAAFIAHELEVPAPIIYHGKIILGNISVPDTDRLACLLGAPSQEEVVDLTQWPEAQQVVDRLGDAFKKATRGGFLDPKFHPECLRCQEDAAIQLGTIDARTARRLASALEFGA
ncbi:hypothetical protein G3I60_05185 [Streptomyces sp. SID13666]|uniref:hypothetical protein n=1 Tax=Streptomyces sp. SID13666 TaxID=2706054 RepID=UPI0013C1919C|nr:hypothetical protein [Streptomyces sp. SID13666]NEA53564.1 hypothetical protein [Streptomyces sp. SID13666]